MRGLGSVFIDKKIEIHTSGGKGRALLLAPNNKWKLLWAPKELDIVAIRRPYNDLDLIITCIYIPPDSENVRIPEFRAICRVIHDFIRSFRCSQHILMGDVNSRHAMLGDVINNHRGVILASSLVHLRFENGIENGPDTWTRIIQRTEEKTWLHMLMINNKLRKAISYSNVSTIPESDHRMLMIVVKGRREAITWFDQYRYKKFISEQDLSFVSTNIINTFEADEICSRLEIIMTNGYEASCSMKRHNARPIKVELVRERRAIRRHIKKNRKHMMKSKDVKNIAERFSNIISLTFVDKNLTRKMRSTARDAKKKKTTASFRNKSRWWIINQIMGRKFVKNVGHSIHTIPSDDASERALNELESEYDVIFPPISRNIDLTEQYEFSLTDQEKKFIINKATNKTCQFEKGLSCKLLKELLAMHGTPIMNFVLATLNKGYIPDSIKRARIQLIPKAAAGKFRPLAILHPLYRLFDTTVFTILSRRDILTFMRPQFGFMKNCGAMDMNMALKSTIENIIAEKPHENLLYISLDLTNAFENISSAAILGGLASLGYSRGERALVYSLIMNRYSFMEFEAGRRYKLHTDGSPQGGFCSPLLFICGLSLIHSFDSDDFRLFLYADDIAIIARGDKSERLTWRKPGEKTTRLIKALERMNLKTNKDKTKVVIAYAGGLKQHLTAAEKFILLDGKDVDVDYKTKILGHEFKTKKLITENSTIYYMTAVDELSNKMESLEMKLTPYWARLQTLRLTDAHLLLGALIRGIANYYGATERIWNEWTTFEISCDKALRIVGSIMVQSLDLHRHMDRLCLGRILIGGDLALTINEMVSRYKIRASTCKFHTAMCELDDPPINPYGMKLLPNDTKFLISGERPNFASTRVTKDRYVIKYGRRKENIDLWFELRLTKNDRVIETKKYDFWICNNSYLDLIVYALNDFITSKELKFLDGTICLEVDRGIQRRLIKPVKRFPLLMTLSTKFERIDFTSYERSSVGINRVDR